MSSHIISHTDEITLNVPAPPLTTSLCVCFCVEIPPVENKDPGRLLLLHLWPARLQRGPRCLLHHDGPGHGGGHLVSEGKEERKEKEEEGGRRVGEEGGRVSMRDVQFRKG